MILKILPVLAPVRQDNTDIQGQPTLTGNGRRNADSRSLAVLHQPLQGFLGVIFGPAQHIRQLFFARQEPEP